MTASKPVTRTLLLAATLSACAATTAHAAVSILDLGTLGGTQSSANGYSSVNALGQVVGYSLIAGDAHTHAYRTAPGSAMTLPASDLGSFTSTFDSYGYGINDVGQVVGESYLSTGRKHAFRTAAGGSITAGSDLGTFPTGNTSSARAINASGQVVGLAEFSGTSDHAFRTLPGGFITAASDLGTMGGGSSYAYGINDVGQVVGVAPTSTGANHAFRTTAGGSITPGSDLGTMGGFISYASAINASGQTVGASQTALGEYHAFRIPAIGTLTPASDLGTLGGTSSDAQGINTLGQAVGYSDTAAGDIHAFMIGATGPMVDLNTLLPVGSGWVLQFATGINDLGQISGSGTFHGDQRAFLMNVPEPTSMFVIALTATALAARRRRCE